jgi:sulfur carrier protein
LPLSGRTATISRMNLVINGDERVISAQTLSALVEELGMKSDRVAIELNREIVHKEQWPQTQLQSGDRLEIVHFVGGGS